VNESENEKVATPMHIDVNASNASDMLEEDVRENEKVATPMHIHVNASNASDMLEEDVSENEKVATPMHIHVQPEAPLYYPSLDSYALAAAMTSEQPSNDSHESPRSTALSQVPGNPLTSQLEHGPAEANASASVSASASASASVSASAPTSSHGSATEKEWHSEQLSDSEWESESELSEGEIIELSHSGWKSEGEFSASFSWSLDITPADEMMVATNDSHSLSIGEIEMNASSAVFDNSSMHESDLSQGELIAR